MSIESHRQLYIHEILYHELYSECTISKSESELSSAVRNRLEQLKLQERRDLISKKKDGCSPLFVACKRGAVNIARFLIIKCDADVDQKGMFLGLMPHGSNLKHHVTPLWYAACTGKMEIAKLLIEHGAYVNSVSNTGATPINTACCMKHQDIAELLVKSGASVLRPDYFGITCLMNSVQNPSLLGFLIQQGAPVNATDHRQRSALHYAIEDGKFESLKVLLENEGDPMLQNGDGDDCLRLACIKGYANIFQYLCENVSYTNKQLAESHELLGATILEQQKDIKLTVDYWTKALSLRHKGNELFPKKALSSAKKPYLDAVEFESRESLEILAVDIDSMHIQSLLINERILGTLHDYTISRLVCRGIAYGSLRQFQRCIDLWQYAIKLQLKKYNLLHPNPSSDVQALTQLYMDIIANPNIGVLEDDIMFEDVISTARVIAEQLPHCIKLMSLRPLSQKRQTEFERIMRALTHLLFVLIRLKKNDEEEEDIRNVTKATIQVDPRTANGDSLLHLVVCNTNTLNSSIFFPYNKFSVFPSSEIVKLLLKCGATVNTTNENMATPLHVAACPTGYSSAVIETLLNHGAHIDQKNKQGMDPYHMLKELDQCKIDPFKYVKLKCIVARKIVACKIAYEGYVHTKLAAFINLHANPSVEMHK